MKNILKKSLLFIPLLLIVLINLYTSKPETCKDLMNYIRDTNLNIVISDIKNPGKSFDVVGYDVFDKKKHVYSPRGGTIFEHISNNMEIGDTLVKERNKYIFTIKKLKKDLIINFACDVDSLIITKYK